MTTLIGKKSTRSNEGNCVEVATPPEAVMVRDSKAAGSDVDVHR